MATLRRQSQALRYGGCQVMYAHDNVVVFVRVYNQQRVLVAINRGEACEVVLEDSPLLAGKTWKIKEGKATFGERAHAARDFRCGLVRQLSAGRMVFTF